MSRRLSLLLEGYLTVESVVGEGTTFTLSLPLAIEPITVTVESAPAGK